MATHLAQFKYSSASLKAMVDKPQDRTEAAAKIFSAAGGKLEALYMSFGEFDGIALVEFPSNVDAAAALLTVGSSGAFAGMQTTVLLGMGDAVKAMEKAKAIRGDYTPPGG